ncbi:MAG: hypothetical protein DYG94_11795 [Leptolyngbya sp. PLA3]|nr:MAG: hypothetical protein EDM82_13150 [Cyanobacteria bacterium CYA]MCE7969407.1 hypothetical protein [Leptolyngbya sp. PL-A3]
MKRLIHIIMGLGREDSPETSPGIEQRLREAQQSLEAQWASTLAELSAQVSERNRRRAEAMRLDAHAQSMRESARAALPHDESAAREHLVQWARVYQASQDAGAQAEALDRQCQAVELRALDLRRRLDESRRNAHTLSARRNAARAQQRLADAVAAGEDHDPAACAGPTHDCIAPSIDLDQELSRLRDELNG